MRDQTVCQRVVSALKSRGIKAYHEYPDTVSIHTRSGLNVWTGLTGWHGSWMEMRDGVMSPIEGERAEVLVSYEVAAGVDALDDADSITRIADRWARCIRAVDSITDRAPSPYVHTVVLKMPPDDGSATRPEDVHATISALDGVEVLESHDVDLVDYQAREARVCAVVDRVKTDARPLDTDEYAAMIASALAGEPVPPEA